VTTISLTTPLKIFLRVLCVHASFSKHVSLQLSFSVDCKKRIYQFEVQW